MYRTEFDIYYDPVEMIFLVFLILFMKLYIINQAVDFIVMLHLVGPLV